MNKSCALLLFTMFLAGCVTTITDVTFSDKACYVALRNQTFVTLTDLFLIREDETKDEYLFQSEHGQLVPYKITDFRGQPLKCANFLNGGSVIGVVKEGTRLKITKICELYNGEIGTYNTIYANIFSPSNNNRTVRIDWLVQCTKTDNATTNGLYIINERLLCVE